VEIQISLLHAISTFALQASIPLDLKIIKDNNTKHSFWYIHNLKWLTRSWICPAQRKIGAVEEGVVNF